MKTIQKKQATLRVSHILFVLLLSAGVLHAQSSENHTLKKDVLDAGGQTSGSANYLICDAVGQPFPLGTCSSAGCSESSGFFADGLMTTGVTEGENPATVPFEFRLEQNYPNPFNPETAIHFQVPAESHVTLKILNVLGREVATLVDGKKDVGAYAIIWHADDAPSGVYICVLRNGGNIQRKKMMLLK